MAESKHDKALNLTDEALAKLVIGKDREADQLIDQAKKLDPSAPEQVLADLNEDAIHKRAFEIWEAAGMPEGQHAEHWEQATQEITSSL